MYVTACIQRHIIVFLQNRKKSTLQISPFNIIFRRLRIYRMMAYHYHPVFFRLTECGVKPFQLRVIVLPACVRIFVAFLAVFRNQRRSVDKYDAESRSVLIESAGVIASSHLPSAAHLSIIQHSLRIAAILMISQYRIPCKHKLRMGIYLLVVCHP